ncbi:MAG: hypothetical protein ABW095_14290 [Candidatus Thiodiazotropha sp.]
MIPLPSGTRAGISNIRARYHALRLCRQVTRETPHQELYGLVDIVTDPAQDQPLPYHHHPDFRFSGHTLADLSRLRHWTDEDRRVFIDWLNQDNQIRHIEQARNRIVTDDFPLLERNFSYPERLYSRLRSKLARIPLQRASVNQWHNTLHNLKQQGVRDDEIRWSGLLPYLTRQEQLGRKSISRKELLDHIDFSVIRLELTQELVSDRTCDLHFVEVPQFNIQKNLKLERPLTWQNEKCAVRYVDTMHYYKVGFIKPTTPQPTGTRPVEWFILDTSDNPVSNPATGDYRFPDKSLAFQAASQHALQHVGVPVEHTPCRRYEHKTLCGGDDYREWLLTLPDYPISHFTGHYHARNLLLHFRTKQRLDLSGRRLLFIEEIQSDWHQSGAMHGYQNRWPGRIPPAPFRKEWIGMALKMLLMHAAELDVDGIAWTGGTIQESHYGKQMQAVRRLYDQEIPRFINRLCRDWQPDLGTTRIQTREPRLHISREMNKWFITDMQGGSFNTRPRYSQQEAIKVMARHCKQLVLEVPTLFLDSQIKNQIRDKGFPLFGE